MAEFQPVRIKTENKILAYKEGQFIIASVPFLDENNNSFGIGVYADLDGVRQKMTMQGEKGEQGKQGLQGIPGVEGPVGPVGPEGKRGATGPIGQQGVQGIQGQRGEQGIEGPPGKPGNIRKWYTSIAEMEADFNSPDIAQYDLAAINSNDTAEDGRMYYKGAAGWVPWTTVKGVEGPQGKQGIQGVQGIQGPRGRGYNWRGAWGNIPVGAEIAEDDVVLDIAGGGALLT